MLEKIQINNVTEQIRYRLERSNVKNNHETKLSAIAMIYKFMGQKSGDKQHDKRKE